jgi:hypothetical protein
MIGVENDLMAFCPQTEFIQSPYDGKSFSFKRREFLFGISEAATREL